MGKPAYVLKINPQKNTVMLGDAEQLKAEYMLAEQDNLIDEGEVFGSGGTDGSHPLSEQTDTLFGKASGKTGDCWCIFETEASAIAPDNQLYSISEKGW